MTDHVDDDAAESITAGSPTTPAAGTPAEFDYRSNELLVALSHESLVVRALQKRGYQVEPIERSSALGLARLVLTPADGTAGNFDALLKTLYRKFARKYHGWVPTMGKNRIVGRVVGSGELSFGGAGDPRPAAPPASWPPSRTGKGRGARVVVIDTAAADASPLAGGWLDRYSDTFPASAGSLVHASGHATFVAGPILGQAPAATVEIRRVLDSAGQATAWDVANAIVQAGLNGADVINLSLVCYTADGEPPLAMAQAINRLDPEIVVIAAAGNHGSAPDPKQAQRPAWPAALPSVIAVGATDRSGKVAPFTPQKAPWIDLLTDGVDLVSTYLQGDVSLSDDALGVWVKPLSGFASWSGTSFAAALVTGAVAADVSPGRVSALTALTGLQRTAGDGRGRNAPFLPLRVDQG